MNLSKLAVISATALAVNVVMSFNASAADNCAQMNSPKFTLPVVERYYELVHPLLNASQSAKTPDQARAIANRIEAKFAELQKTGAELAASDAHLQCLIKNKMLDANSSKGVIIMKSLEEFEGRRSQLVENLSRLAPEKANVFRTFAATSN